MSRYRGGGTTLYLRNLSDRVRYEDIRKLFQKYGRLVDVTIPLDYRSRQPKGYCFIEYEDPRDAEKAQYHMDRRRLFDREIEVEFARGDRKTPGEMRTRDHGSDSRRRDDRRRGDYGRMDYDRDRDSRRSRSRSRSRSRDRYARGGGYERRDRSGDRRESSHRRERSVDRRERSVDRRDRSPLERPPRRERSGDRVIDRPERSGDRSMERRNGTDHNGNSNGIAERSPYSRSKSRSYSKNRTPSPRSHSANIEHNTSGGGDINGGHNIRKSVSRSRSRSPRDRSNSRDRSSLSPSRRGLSPKVGDSSMHSRSRSRSRSASPS